MDVTAATSLAGGIAGTGPVLKPQPLPPDDEVVDAFKRALDPSAAPSAADGAAPAVQSPDSQRKVTAQDLGDAILSTIKSVTASTQDLWNHVQNGLPASGQLHVSGLVEFQAQIMSFTVMYELVGKSIQKATQDLDALLKMQ